MLIKNECKGFQLHFVQLRTFKVFSVPQLHKETNKKIHPPIPCLPAKVITPLYENVLIKNQISYRHKINYSSGHKNGVLIYYCCFRRLKEQAFIWLLQKLSNRPYFLMEKNVVFHYKHVYCKEK